MKTEIQIRTEKPLNLNTLRFDASPLLFLSSVTIHDKKHDSILTFALGFLRNSAIPTAKNLLRGGRGGVRLMAWVTTRTQVGMIE